MLFCSSKKSLLILLLNKNNPYRLVRVVQICNPNNLGGKCRRIMIKASLSEIERWRSFLKKIVIMYRFLFCSLGQRLELGPETAKEALYYKFYYIPSLT